MQSPELLNNLAINVSAACVERVNHPLPEKFGVSLFIKRDDLLHPIISGNKWRKLKYLLIDALDKNYTHMISMGGAWSNHLHALAWAGQQCGFKTTGIIRGDAPAEESDTLRDMRAWGMNLEFVSRAEFRQLRAHQAPDSAPAQVRQAYWIPEGGATPLALAGIAEIFTELDQPYDLISTACGTGTTLAGLISALPAGMRAVGFPAIKGGDYLATEIQQLLAIEESRPVTRDWSLQCDYHFGGFARHSPELLDFISAFEQHTDIPLEPVYTGKMFYGLFDLIQRGEFAPGTRILALHTGGLQGKRGIKPV